jgi:hypothetical protein
MPTPASPAPDLVVIQAHFALGGFTELLNDLTGPRYSHHLGQRGVPGRKDNRAPQRGRVARTAPHQQPAAPAGVHRVGQGQPLPVVPAWSFRSAPGTEARPTVLRQGGQDRFHLPWPPVQPDVFLARNCQDIGLRLGFQPQPHPALIPIHAIARHPLSGYTSGEHALQHLSRQLWLRRTAPAEWRLFLRKPASSSTGTVSESPSVRRSRCCKV